MPLCKARSVLQLLWALWDIWRVFLYSSGCPSCPPAEVCPVFVHRWVFSTNPGPCESLELFLCGPLPTPSASLPHRFQLPQPPLTPASVFLIQPGPCGITALHAGQESASRQKARAAILRDHSPARLLCNVWKRSHKVLSSFSLITVGRQVQSQLFPHR